MSGFQWTEQKSAAALALAEGYTQQQVADRQGLSDRTIRRWLADSDFSQEVDRLSLMIGVAARAERLRIAQRVVREKMGHGILASDKDLLDWLKFAQSETDGVKLDLASTLLEVEASLAGRGQDRPNQSSQGADKSKASGEREPNLP